MRRLLSYPSLVATLALVIALSGGAYAAGLIGTSQIKNGAVTTAKMHKRAITPTRLAPPVLAAIQGAAATGSPVVYSASNSGIQQIGPTNLILATMTIGQPGSYLLTGSLRVFSRQSNPGHSLFCDVSNGGPSLVNVFTEVSQVLMVPLTGMVTTTSPNQTISLTCHQGIGPGEITATYDLYAAQVLPAS